MIVKRRKGKQAAEAWSLNWCEPLMAQTGDVNDLNDWLFLVTSTKTQKLRCIAVSSWFKHATTCVVR